MDSTFSLWRKMSPFRFIRLYLIATIGILPFAILYATLTGYGAGFGPRAASILLGIFSGLALSLLGERYLSKAKAEILRPVSVEVSSDKLFSNAVFIPISSTIGPFQHAPASSTIWTNRQIAA
jgi:hypothetical protein